MLLKGGEQEVERNIHEQGSGRICPKKGNGSHQKYQLVIIPCTEQQNERDICKFGGIHTIGKDTDTKSHNKTCKNPDTNILPKNLQQVKTVNMIYWEAD